RIREEAQSGGALVAEGPLLGDEQRLLELLGALLVFFWPEARGEQSDHRGQYHDDDHHYQQLDHREPPARRGRKPARSHGSVSTGTEALEKVAVRVVVVGAGAVRRHRGAEAQLAVRPRRRDHRGRVVRRDALVLAVAVEAVTGSEKIRRLQIGPTARQERPL